MAQLVNVYNTLSLSPKVIEEAGQESIGYLAIRRLNLIGIRWIHAGVEQKQQRIQDCPLMCKNIAS